MPTMVATLTEARAGGARAVADGDLGGRGYPTRAGRRALSVDFSPETFRLTLDCGDRADLAHAALAEGLRRVRLNCHPAAMAAIQDVASQLGAEVVASEPT